MQTPTAKGWMVFGDSSGRTGGWIVSPEGPRNSTGRPAELINLDSWGSQSLNHQPTYPQAEPRPPHTNLADVQLGLPVGTEQLE
ncbi:rCG62332, isoform CRA_a [Rattus norvegicus]|uniref:RCG62332, isoform CRA_a n=1 Tax=Rattus norvegicus TaxID=10116 RepID=A6HB82_RAT|nr:rCG62332, isoform CRA_a [Rattus norvegicus]EDM03287.1 rCG62332, isoform CRA_a [Rattus norvegicus]